MTQDTFVKIIRSVAEAKGVNFFGSKVSKLNALARQYSRGEVSIQQAVETIQLIFKDDFNLGRHEYAEIEKRLRRS